MRLSPLKVQNELSLQLGIMIAEAGTFSSEWEVIIGEGVRLMFQVLAVHRPDHARHFLLRSARYWQRGTRPLYFIGISIAARGGATLRVENRSPSVRQICGRCTRYPLNNCNHGFCRAQEDRPLPVHWTGDGRTVVRGQDHVLLAAGGQRPRAWSTPGGSEFSACFGKGRTQAIPFFKGKSDHDVVESSTEPQ